MKRIAILTSGGDAPGMNACIRAATRYALSKGFDVYGVERGYQGLIEGELFRMGSRNVSGIIHKGGTFLKTARCPEFKTLDGQRHAAETLGAFGIDGLICIGGDGTFRGAKDLSDNFGVNVIGIPGTIDNDLAYTDYTLGFDTAVNTCIWAINCLRDTMGSHDRVSLLEVMGRRCGDIALYAGIAGGAEYILVPEVPYDLDAICKSISMSQKRGKTSNMIILAEGAGNQADVCKYILEKRASKSKQPRSVIFSAAAVRRFPTACLRRNLPSNRSICCLRAKPIALSAYATTKSSTKTSPRLLTCLAPSTKIFTISH